VAPRTTPNGSLIAGSFRQGLDRVCDALDRWLCKVGQHVWEIRFDRTICDRCGKEMR